MAYKKKLKPRKIVENEIPLFHCTKCDTYLLKEKMILKVGLPDGVSRVCKVCYSKHYHFTKGERANRARRTAEELLADEQANKEFKHLNLYGVTDEDRESVMLMFKKMGFDTTEPIWKQWYERHHFEIPNDD